MPAEIKSNLPAAALSALDECLSTKMTYAAIIAWMHELGFTNICAAHIAARKRALGMPMLDNKGKKSLDRGRSKGQKILKFATQTVRGNNMTKQQVVPIQRPAASNIIKTESPLDGLPEEVFENPMDALRPKYDRVRKELLKLMLQTKVSHLEIGDDGRMTVERRMTETWGDTND